MRARSDVLSANFCSSGSPVCGMPPGICRPPCWLVSSSLKFAGILLLCATAARGTVGSKGRGAARDRGEARRPSQRAKSSGSPGARTARARASHAAAQPTIPLTAFVCAGSGCQYGWSTAHATKATPTGLACRHNQSFVYTAPQTLANLALAASAGRARTQRVRCSAVLAYVNHIVMCAFREGGDGAHPLYSETLRFPHTVPGQQRRAVLISMSCGPGRLGLRAQRRQWQTRRQPLKSFAACSRWRDCT